MSMVYDKNIFGKLFIIEADKKTSYNFAYIDKYVNIICSSPEETYKIVKKQQWINAISADGKQIVFSVGDARFTWGNINILRFRSPITIYGNIKIDRSRILTFNQIYFYGKLVNHAFPASKIIELNKDNGLSLKFKENKEVDLEKNYQNKFNIIATIGGPLNWEYGKIFDIAKTITSKIKLVFNRAQRINKIFEYVKVFNKIMVLLCGRNNVDFEIGIRVKSSIGNKPILNDYKVYVDTGNSEQYSDIAKIENVIKVEKIWDNIDKIFNLFLSDFDQPMLDYLIDNNRNEYSGFNIINTCNSINNEFDIKAKNDKEFQSYAIQYIQTIKRIEFTEKDRKKHITLLKNKKDYSKFFLKIKIEIIFKYYYKQIAELHKEFRLDFCRFIAPNKFLYYLPKFLSIRNSAAHSEVQWSDGKHLFGYVDLLIYFCIFERLGYDINIIKYELANLHCS